MSENILSYDIPAIKECQQNRFPLLFIDKIDSCIPGSYAQGVKCFSYNEWYFPAHFEDQPNVPGFIQIEVLVQTFLMTFLTLDQHKGKKTNFISVDNVKFKKQIIPGDKLIIESQLLSFKRGIAKGISIGKVDGLLVCSAEFVVAIPDVLSSYKPKNN